ncbi:glycosyltransferase family 2 protein [Omnitrophica bacterium]|nr:glycosyltransferase family 2 protein [Candidatus Omnitrophota bacterium]
MSFEFSRHNLTPAQSRWERFFQIIPGLISWANLLGIVALSIIKPIAAAIVMMAFVFYWMLRLFYVTIFIILSFVRLSMEENENWPDRLKRLDEFFQTGRIPERNQSVWAFRQWLSARFFEKSMHNLRDLPRPPLSNEIVHLIIIPVSRETDEVVRPGLESLVHQNHPKDRLMVILSVEEHAPDEVKKALRKAAREYRDFFSEFLVVEHPSDLPGEARVKGANVTFAARQAQAYFKEKDIPLERVVVSCFDADTIVSKNYFSCLTYNFLVCRERLRASFQPIPVYQNNIWDTIGFARVLEMGASFFQLMEATNPEKLVTFSSHSMSFKALVDVDFWPVDMISDDSAIFWKALIHYNGDYRVVPMYVTVSMDVVAGDSIWKTAVDVYRQKRRWAWGVENFPIVMRGFLQNKEFPVYNKFRYGWKLLEGHVAWATWPFMLTVMGWLPTLFARQELLYSVVYYNAPLITGLIFNMATISLLTTIILSLCLLPRRKFKYSFLKRIQHALEWLLVPVIAIFFSGMPALDAQTRLMFGRYMEFWVTDKKKAKERPGV